MNPDDLLQQIVDLCTQYVGSGGDPNQLMDALAQSWQGAPDDQGNQGDQGALPPPEGGDQLMNADAVGGVPDLSEMMPSAPPSSNGGQHPFADASAMAIEDMKRKSKAR